MCHLQVVGYFSPSLRRLIEPAIVKAMQRVEGLYSLRAQTEDVGDEEQTMKRQRLV